MKQNICFIIFACTAFSSSSDAVATNFNNRSQSVDLARQLVGVREIEESLKCSDDCFPGYIAVTTEFTKSFNAKDISRCLFGNCLANNGCCQSIHISGSTAENRGTNHLLADYFGLPTNYKSTINFNPHIINVIGDLQGYFRLDRWLCGLYFYIHAPITHTKWNLGICEDVINAGGADYAQGYFAPESIARKNLVSTASEFFSGRGAPDLGDDVTFNKLNYARWASGDCGARTKTALADLRFWLGYDYLDSECFGLGFGIVVAAPTGNAPDARYLFEPVVGNGKHWELGAMLKGDYVIWENSDATDRISIYSQANITHLFDAKQCRTFDLCGKPLSRYMLAEKLGANDDVPYLYGSPDAAGLISCVNPVNLSEATLSNAQFAGVFTPVANLTTFCVDVSANVQVDWATVLTYSRCNFTWDLGYELWYRGCEKIKFNECDENRLIAANTWALKGDAAVYGVSTCPTSPFIDGQAVALAATESNATIKAGTNAGSITNAGIDNAQFAYGGNAASTPTLFSTIDNQVVNLNQAEQTRTSIQPVFLKSTDIDLCGARTQGFSNKLFTHVSYYWDCTCLQPFFGVGAMGEFGTNKNNCTSNDDCQKCSISQWGVWFKGGFVFG